MTSLSSSLPLSSSSLSITLARIDVLELKPGWMGRVNKNSLGLKDNFFPPFDSGAQFSPQGSRNSPQKAFGRPGSLAGERLVDCRHLARFAAEASPGNNKGLGGCLVVWTTNRGWEQLQLGHISIFRRAPVIPSSSSITCRCNGRMSYCHIVTTSNKCESQSQLQKSTT